MHRPLPRFLLPPAAAAAVAIFAAAQSAQNPGQPQDLNQLKQEFAHPPDSAKIMMRWWWFGSAVVKPELEREMRAMKQGGIGGVEVQPVYPLTLDDPEHGLKNLPYLSPEFLDALTFAGQRARALGLRLDLTLCSGWPYGGPHIPIAQAAGRLRVDRAPVADGAKELAAPRIGAGEELTAVFVGKGEHYERVNAAAGSPIALPADMEAGSTALVFVSSRTRMMVKRPAAGAEGFVLDHYDRAAIDDHLKTVGEKLLGALSATPPYAVFSDSLEVERSDWTPNFLAEFQKRRGYDLTPHLPAIAADIGPETGAVRNDWGRTLTELANENYLTPIREWAHQHGTLFRSQTYGTPPVSISSEALADLPEGEGSQWRHASSTRWASSASHIYGRPVTSSETWTWLHSPVFRATPLDMKAEADLHFLQGINQLVGHGWPYSPPQAGEPGWRFYAAAVFNDHNPWWLVMPEITSYLQRVSYLLRQGQPANDVGLYVPNADIYAHFTIGNDSINKALDARLGPNMIPQILDAGYNFDLIDDGAIAARGIPYKVLVMPAVERIPLAAYQKIAEYAAKGGIVVATGRTPSLAPGFMEAASETPKIAEISKSLFAGRGHLVADDAKLGEQLKALLDPDVERAPEVGFIHRTLPYAEVYFLANTSNHPVKTSATFRVTGMAPAAWDPYNGGVQAGGVSNRLNLDLAPYESRVVVFSKEREPAPPPETFAPAVPMDLSNNWVVRFGGSAQPRVMPQLVSWTDLPETKYFSGQATYDHVVVLTSAGRYTLDFGEGTPVTTEERRAGSGMRAMLESPVREAAQVIANGRVAGYVWKPPYKLEIGGYLFPGGNQLRITVANLAINEMASGPLPDYKALNAKYGERFQAQDLNNLQPVPAGILGKVRLIPH